MRRGIKVVHSCCSTQHSKGNPRLSFHIPFSLFAFPSFNHQWMHISITLGEGRFSHLELLRVSLMLPLIPPIHPTFCIPIFLLYPWIVHTLHLCILTPPHHNPLTPRLNRFRLNYFFARSGRCSNYFSIHK